MAGIGGVVLNFAAKTTDAVRDVGKLTGALDSVRRKAGGADSAMGKMGKAAKLGIAGAGVAAAAGVAIFVDFAKAAIQDAAAADKLARSLSKVTKATKAQLAANELWIQKMMFTTGIEDEQIRPALERIARSTKNLGKAQKLTTLAMDIAAGTGKKTTVVAQALARANDGNLNALKRLGITLGDNAENARLYGIEQGKLLKAQGEASAAMDEHGRKSKEYKAAMDKVALSQATMNRLAAAGIDWQKELGKEFDGAAARAGNTIEGTWERLILIFGELKESVAQGVLPVMQTFADWFADSKNIDKVQGWITKIGEWSTAVGEEFAGKIKEFVKWLQSDEGHRAMKQFAEDVKQIADAFVAIANAFKSVIDWWNKLPSWIRSSRAFGDRVNAIAGLTGLGGGGNGGGQPKPPEDPNSEWVWVGGRRYKRGTEPGAVRKQSSSTGGGSVVNITIHNPKPEKASMSVAAGLRVSRPNTVSV